MKKNNATFCIILILVILMATTIQAQETKKVKVFYDNYAMYQTLQEMSLEIIKRDKYYIEIFTTADELTKIKQRGFETEIIHEDVVAFYQSRLLDPLNVATSETTGSMGGYKTLVEIDAAVDSIIAEYPDLITQRTVIGQSIEGRDIWAVKISDNPEIDEDEPEILFQSGIHGYDVMSIEVLLLFMRHLTKYYGQNTEITNLVNSREIWFLLVMNPDGYYRNEVTFPAGGGIWRKNRRDNGDGTFGVDLNRNFSYKWGLDAIGSSSLKDNWEYRGTGPFSEPEAQAVRDFVESHDFSLLIDYIAFGDRMHWPWEYKWSLNKEQDIFSMLTSNISLYNSYTDYFYDTDGYLINGGITDWAYGETETKNSIFSLSILPGSRDFEYWPPPINIFSISNQNLNSNIFLCEIAGTINELKRPEKPLLFVDPIVDSSSYQINWILEEIHNPAIEYELYEMTGYNPTTDMMEDSSNWENNIFLLTTDIYYSAPTSFYSTSDNNLIAYIETRDQYLVNPNDSITFKCRYDIESDFDYAYVEISVNNQDFISIEGNFTSTYNPNGNNIGHGITGTTNQQWVDAYFNISQFAGQYINIRILYITDPATFGEGIYVDDFYPIVNFDSTVIISSTLTETTYSFTDKPLEEYYYKVRGKDAQDQWSKYSNPLKTIAINTTDICYASGDMDGIPGVTYNDFLVFQDFFDGISPLTNPYYLGDLNGDCFLSIDDLSLLECYINSGASCFETYPVPTCCIPQFDYDGDGVIDELDLCKYIPNPEQLDPDNDGIGSSCDNCPLTYNPSQIDTDGDFIGDECDNCLYTPNSIQHDTDGDNIGDDCEMFCCFGGIRGNVDFDVEDIIDISDLVYLVDFMFTSGPEPKCQIEANVDGDAGEIVDISDLVYLVDFMFSSGPPLPLCP